MTTGDAWPTTASASRLPPHCLRRVCLRRPAVLRRPRLAVADSLRHQHKGRSARGPRAAPLPAGSQRGPYSRRPRHRPAQFAPVRHRPEPDLTGDRLPRTRPPGLDADACSDQPDRPSQQPAPPTPGKWNPAPTRHNKRTVNLPQLQKDRTNASWDFHCSTTACRPYLP